ncbi:MAG: GNAT family N-acetyltransferase [Cellulosilyticaceae bacterium]
MPNTSHNGLPMNMLFVSGVADRYEHFPLTADILNEYYKAADHSDSFWPMTAFDETGVVGHFIMRFTDPSKETLRLGFIIIDAEKRGKGYGKEMVQLALQFAFDVVKVKKVTLGVFENNPSAYHAYKASGFTDVPVAEPESYEVFGETWNCVEMEILNVPRGTF